MHRLRLLACALAPLAAAGAYCGGAPNPNAVPNPFAINTSAPTFLRSVANGHAYLAGTPGFQFYVNHVYGSAYDMGMAQGLLHPAELKDMVNKTWNYMVGQVDSNLPMLPSWLAELIGEVGLELALDALIDLTKPSTGAYFYEELAGLAAGAGVDRKRLERIHLIGELTQGDCSMIGAWGAATAGGKTLQLRALDWDTDGPFREYPAVTVYHPTTPGAHPFTNVGLLGFIGTFTGQSSAQMGVSEIGVSYPDTEHFGTETFAGVPFVYLLRDVLEFDNTVFESVQRMENANRTCDLILGVGDGKAQTARSFAYSGSSLFVFDDKNLEPYNATPDTWHPRFDSVVWHAMDWLCPGYVRAGRPSFARARRSRSRRLCSHPLPFPPRPCFFCSRFPWRRSSKSTGGSSRHRSSSPTLLRRSRRATCMRRCVAGRRGRRRRTCWGHQTHILRLPLCLLPNPQVYDLTDQQLYVSFMAKKSMAPGEPEMAYDRPWAQLDLNSLFALAPPAL